MAYADEVIADSPHQWLRFLEPSGSTADDSSGNNNDGELLGSPTRVTGPVDSAVAFNGSSQALDTEVDIGEDSADMSIEWWMRTEDTTNETFWMGCSQISGPEARFTVQQDVVPSVVDVRFPGFSGSTSGHEFDLTGTAVWDGEWHHLVITTGHSTFGVRLYIDGQLHQTVAPNSFDSFDQWGDTLVVAARRNAGVGPQGHVEMDVAEWAMYTTGLSGARVEAHYAAATEAEPVDLDGTDTVQAQTTTAAALTQTHELDVDGTTQAQSATAATLTQTHALSADSATEAQSATAATLTQIHELQPTSATQDQTATAAVLAQTHALAATDTTQAQTAEDATVTQGVGLTPASTVHAQQADTTALAQVHALAPVDALHTQTADAAAVLGDVLINLDFIALAPVFRSRVATAPEFRQRVATSPERAHGDAGEPEFTDREAGDPVFAHGSPTTPETKPRTALAPVFAHGDAGEPTT